MDLAWSYWVVALWGMVVLASWVGWGSAACRWAGMAASRKTQRANWALRAAVGMAIEVVIGGVLMALHAAGPEELGIVILVGAAVAVYGVLRHWRELAARGKNLDRMGWIATAVFLLAATLVYLSSINTPGKLNATDDMTAYQVFVQRLLQTGTILEPFNARRLTAYGGQQILQAPLVVVGDTYSANIIDMGLASILLLGLGTWLVRGHTPARRWAQIAVIGLVVLAPVPRINTQAQASMAALLLAMFVLMEWQPRGVRTAVLVGVVAGAVCSLRMNVIPVAGLVLVLGYGLERRWKELGVALGVTAAALAGFAWALYESSGSLMFPLMAGTFRKEFELTVMEKTMGDRWQVLGNFFTRAVVVGMVVPAVLMLCRRMRSAAALYVAAVIGTALVVWMMPKVELADGIRFTYCFLLPAAVAVLALRLARGRMALRWAGAAGIVAAILLPGWRQVGGQLWERAHAAWVGPGFQNGYPIPLSVEAYQQAQRAVPAGAKFFAATGAPLVFDYRRNVIYNADCPGMASLPPGLPIFEGPEAMKRYLLGIGVQYIVAADFDRDVALYARKRWESDVKEPPGTDPRYVGKYPAMLAFMGNIDALAKSEEVVFAGGDLRVIRLRR